MNFSTIAGFSLSFIVFLASILLSSNNLMIFLDVHALLIVFGGSAAATLVCFSLSKIATLLKVFYRRMIGQNKIDTQALITEIIALSKASISGQAAYEAAVGSVKNLFLKDAASVLFWIEADVPGDELKDLLHNRSETQYSQYMDEANMFRTIAKFPPAFGLMGTTLGMIKLLQSLGGANAKESIGPAMAIGLVATLHGIALANFVFIPIAEQLTKQTKETRQAHRMVVEGIMMIHAGLPTKFIEEKVRSFLLPGLRYGSDSKSQPQGQIPFRKGA